MKKALLLFGLLSLSSVAMAEEQAVVCAGINYEHFESIKVSCQYGKNEIELKRVDGMKLDEAGYYRFARLHPYYTTVIYPLPKGVEAPVKELEDIYSDRMKIIIQKDCAQVFKTKLGIDEVPMEKVSISKIEARPSVNSTTTYKKLATCKAVKVLGDKDSATEVETAITKAKESK